ncbi:hypothetical protein RJ639_046641 [Escallonia herrerae]|uniref:Uncharacterized protein n=1 Tax=Escallonia herrerae TaxID=1293975 RepID=A0AA88W847_9ASTE|nr:hypothetical protein RJ639_046641 [Escallonia herrerae]
MRSNTTYQNGPPTSSVLEKIRVISSSPSKPQVIDLTSPKQSSSERKPSLKIALPPVRKFEVLDFAKPSEQYTLGKFSIPAGHNKIQQEEEELVRRNNGGVGEVILCKDGHCSGTFGYPKLNRVPSKTVMGKKNMRRRYQ